MRVYVADKGKIFTEEEFVKYLVVKGSGDVTFLVSDADTLVVRVNESADVTNRGTAYEEG